MPGAKSVFYETREKLRPEYGPEADSLSYLLLNDLFGLSRVDIMVDKPIEFRQDRHEKLEESISRLLSREPVQYILGMTDFLDRTFVVGPGVLIPRPETEQLVHLVKKTNSGPDPSILDIGSGSGCIAISLALEIPEAKVIAWEISPSALEITRKNADRLNAAVKVQKIDIFADDLPGAVFDIIVSNPPYVPESEKEIMDRNILDHEPEIALFVDDTDPLKFYRRIIDLSEDFLARGGLIFFEIHENSGESVGELMRAGNFNPVKVVRDIHGKDRFAWGQKS